MLRLCLDLNIWVAALLADRKGRVNKAHAKALGAFFNVSPSLFFDN
jgi:hypothetical protein